MSKHWPIDRNGRGIEDLRDAEHTALLSKTEEGLGNLVDDVKEHIEANFVMLNFTQK